MARAFLIAASLVACLVGSSSLAADRLSVLFLGDQGHHQPAARFAQLEPVLAGRGIQLTYTEDLGMLSAERLKPYAALVIYANQESITPTQEQALLDYVSGGGGLVALHCASFCFLNSDRYVELVGAQFLRHGGQVFGTQITGSDHPVMAGFGGFRSWDETYIHHRHNEDRTVLEERHEGEQAPERTSEPWTWVRDHGKGRVFYTAWGHDERTWSQPGFQNLVERGIRWAANDDPSLAGSFKERAPFSAPKLGKIPADAPAFEYEEVGAKIPNYVPSDRWGTLGEPLTKMQRPLAPEASQRHYAVPENFQLELFAAEPDLAAKPIAMTWDEQGRLWVCETVDYPNELRPPGTGRDRIQIVEDRDHDGKADHFTVFAEGLSIPTAITCYRGGVIVQDGTRTIYLKDTDGDLRADVNKVLIEGWAMGDTHGGVSNFRYGFDNWIWAMQGYNDSQPVYAGNRDAAEKQRFRQGFFRFRLSQTDPPEVEELEFVRSTNNNTWGLGFSEEGLVFGSTANGCPSVFMPIANRYYEQVAGWSPQVLEMIADSNRIYPIVDHIRQVDHHGGYTAGAGHALYTARAYPEPYWNRTAFVCEPTGHLVGLFVLEPRGAGFAATSPGSLLASDDDWAAPIQAEVGPDGQVWVLDWYNFIVQHNPTPIGFQTGKGNAYETDLRDKQHGRIYRLAYREAPAVEMHSLADATPEQLVVALRNDNLLWRQQAQRLLVERGKQDIVPALIALLADPQIDDLGLDVGAIHALWTLHGLGAIDQPEVQAVLPQALGHASPAVRRTALTVLTPTADQLNRPQVLALLQDSDPQVRLAAILKQAESPTSTTDPAAADAAAAVIERLGGNADRWLADAATSAGAAHAEACLRSLLASAKGPLSPTAAAAVARIAEHYARTQFEKPSNELLLAVAGAEPSRAAAVLEGFSRGWPNSAPYQMDADTQAALMVSLERWPTGPQRQLLMLARRWGNDAFNDFAGRLTDDLISQFENQELDVRERADAIRTVVELQGEQAEVIEQLLERVNARTAPQDTLALIEAVSASRAEETGNLLVDRLAGLTPVARKAAFRVLLSRPQWTIALLDGIESGSIAATELALDQRQALGNYPDRRIRERAGKILRAEGGLPSVDRQAVVDRYMPVTTTQGDSTRGKALFVEHCSKCHRHGELGVQIGPELTGMAVHPKAELLVHVLDPSRSVEGNFRTYTVLTADGQVVNGMLAGETKTTVELIDTAAQRIVVQRDDIEELTASAKSVMPEGFEAQLNEEGMRDLLEFLTQRGKYLPIDLRKVASACSTVPMFYGVSPVERLDFGTWEARLFESVPFSLIDPQQDRVNNCVMLFGPLGELPPKMPKAVDLPVGGPVKRFHILGGIGGWSAQRPNPSGPVTMVFRIRYKDGQIEDHELRDGREFADYIGPFDVPGSKRAFDLDGRQVRYLTIDPKRSEPIERIELRKGRADSAPIVLAITAESP
jgi:hypothetical protein